MRGCRELDGTFPDGFRDKPEVKILKITDAAVNEFCGFTGSSACKIAFIN